MKKWAKCGIIGFLSGFLNGLFGSGGGLAAVPLLEKFLGIEPKKAHATSVAIILPLSFLSAFLYLKSGNLDFSEAVWFILFGVPGAFVGSVLLKKISNRRLKKIFGALLIFASVRMVVRLCSGL